MSSVLKLSKEYMALIRRFPLRPIKNEKMLDMASGLYSELVLKGRRRLPDEEDYLVMLGKIIHDYESEHLPPLAKPMDSRRALASLMEDNNLSQSQLAFNLGVSQSIISEFLATKRGLSKRLISKLAAYFK